MPIITFAEDGTVEFTRKPAVAALFRGQRRDEVRMSEIIFDNDTQLYKIKFLTSMFEGEFVGTAVLNVVDPDENMVMPVPAALLGKDGTYYFHTYDQAICVEVFLIDHIRRLFPYATFHE